MIAVAASTAAAILAALITYFGARYQARVQAESDQEREERELIATLKASLAEIKGSALDIRDTRAEVGRVSAVVREQFDELARNLGAVVDRVDSVSAQQSGQEAEPFLTMLAVNPHITSRVSAAAEEKRALGRYLASRIVHNASVVLDCGTTIAWAFNQLLESGMEFRSIVTNNVLVSAMCSDDPDAVPVGTLSTDELPSTCRLTPGRFYPSYSAVFPDETDDVEEALRHAAGPDWILIGTTSLDVQTGPRGKSAANRRFKRELLDLAQRNPGCRVAVLVDIDKLGLQLGDPADAELWATLCNSLEVLILVSGTADDDQARARVQEELRKCQGLVAAGWKLNLTFVGVNGRAVQTRLLG